MCLTFILIGIHTPLTEFRMKMEMIEIVEIAATPHLRVLPWGISDVEIDTMQHQHANENYDGEVCA